MEIRSDAGASATTLPSMVAFMGSSLLADGLESHPFQLHRTCGTSRLSPAERFGDGNGSNFSGPRRGCPLGAGPSVLPTSGARHHAEKNEEIDDQHDHHGSVRR